MSVHARCYLKQTSPMYILLSVTHSMPCHTIVRLITFHVYTSNAFSESSSPLLSFMLTTQSGSSPSCSFSQLSWNTGQCIQSWNVPDPGTNYAEYVCNAITLVWGSLRLAPCIQFVFTTLQLKLTLHDSNIYSKVLWLWILLKLKIVDELTSVRVRINAAHTSKDPL